MYRNHISEAKSSAICSTNPPDVLYEFGGPIPSTDTALSGQDLRKHFINTALFKACTHYLTLSSAWEITEWASGGRVVRYAHLAAAGPSTV